MKALKGFYSVAQLVFVESVAAVVVDIHQDEVVDQKEASSLDHYY
jgi:hypothetical protein